MKGAFLLERVRTGSASVDPVQDEFLSPRDENTFGHRRFSLLARSNASSYSAISRSGF